MSRKPKGEADYEIEAMRKILLALQGFQPQQQQRILTWAFDYIKDQHQLLMSNRRRTDKTTYDD